MAHFVKLDNNNIVLDVNVVSNNDINNLPFPESESIGIEFLKAWSGGYENWKQTSYNASFRKNYAGIGYKYDSELDAFISPKPFNSWILDEDKAQWKAPVDMPTDDKRYTWNEETTSWDLVED
jgi:hypothetical protein